MFTLIAAVGLAVGGGEIDRVVVMADRAEVTRVQPFSCVKGKGTARFGLLPAGLDVRALRAEAPAGAEVLGVTHTVEPLEKDRDVRVRKLEAEIDELRGKIEVLEATRVRQAARSTTIAEYGQYFLSLWREEIRNPNPRNSEEWAAVLDQMLKQRLSLATATGEAARDVRDVRRQLEILERRLAKLNPHAVPEGVEVTVGLSCKRNSTVALTYVLPGATWRPEYDLRFRPAKAEAKTGPGSASITVAAVVQQTTGEDWTNVEVVLSTSKPRLGSEAPRPARIRVVGGERTEGRVMVEAKERRTALAQRKTEAGPAPAAEFEDRGQSFALVIPRRVTIKADGRPYWMPVDLLTAEATTKLVAVPKVRGYVFRAVELDNPAPYALLAGTVHAYRDRGGTESYVGDTALEYKGPGEPIEISLGIDEELRVVRKELEDLYEEAGTFESTQRLRRGYVIEVTNNGAAAAVVEVRENVPVSKSEEIEVEIDQTRTTGDHTFDGYRGFLAWSLELGRGKAKEIKLAYSIGLPEEWEVGGGR